MNGSSAELSLAYVQADVVADVALQRAMPADVLQLTLVVADVADLTFVAKSAESFLVYVQAATAVAVANLPMHVDVD